MWMEDVSDDPGNLTWIIFFLFFCKLLSSSCALRVGLTIWRLCSHRMIADMAQKSRNEAVHIMIIYSWFLFMSSQTINFRVIAMIKVMLSNWTQFGFEISSLLSMCSLLRYQSIPHNILNWIRMQSTELNWKKFQLTFISSRQGNSYSERTSGYCFFHIQ